MADEDLQRREHRIVAADGWPLHVWELRPPTEPRAVAVLGHAMMVDSRTLLRESGPCLAATLARAGILCLVVDLRGHGRSGLGASAGGSWTYEQLVDDTRSYLELAERLAPTQPIFMVGNSLFGHTSLAYVGQNLDAPVRGFVAFAVNIWTRRYSASPARQALKELLGVLSTGTARTLGYLPARAIGFGTQDEPQSYWNCMSRWISGERWDAADGTDYGASLSAIARPFLHVVSDGDRLLCHPDDAELFARDLGPYRTTWRLGDACQNRALTHLRPAPGHVEMVAHRRCEALWSEAASWILAKSASP